MKVRIQAVVDASIKPVFDFAGPTVTIGRDAGCDLPMTGTTNVSARHAQILLGSDGASLIDLESTNGTFLNDRRIEGRKKLRKGDFFRLGQTGPCFQITELDLTTASASPARAGTVRDRATTPHTAHEPAAGFRPPERPAGTKAFFGPAPEAPLAATAARPVPSASSGQTRLMVMQLQKTNRKLMIAVGVAVLVLFILGGTTLLYLVRKQDDLNKKQDDLSSKTADLGDTAKKLQEKTDGLDQSVGKVVTEVEKLTKNEEDDIFSRYAEAVYLVEIAADKGFIAGTAFALDKNGKLGTNAHIAHPAAQALKAGKKVTVISQGGKKQYPVTGAVSHPKYIQWPGNKIQYQTPDVGILNVRLPPGEFLPKFVDLASEEDLRKLKPGAQLCYIGFPGWSKYDSLKRIEPHIYGGGLTRLMTLKEESGDFSSQFLLQHDMSSMGGASGSPIFNRHGKVVAIHNSGRIVSTSGPQGVVQDIPVGPKNGMRIDLLNELLK